MAKNGFLNFAVIELLKSTRKDLDPYEIVPSSWIRYQDLVNDSVLLGYPSENKLNTLIRIMEQQPVNLDWPLLPAKVVFHADSQVEAMRYIAMINENKSSSTENNQLSVQSSSKDSIVKKDTLPAPKKPVVIKSPLNKINKPDKSQRRDLEKKSLNQLFNKKSELMKIMNEFNLAKDVFATMESMSKHPPNKNNQTTANHQVSTTPSDSETEESTHIVSNNKNKSPTNISEITENININQRPKRNVPNKALSVYTTHEDSSNDSFICTESHDSDYEYPKIISNRKGMSSTKSAIPETSAVSSASATATLKTSVISTPKTLNEQKNNEQSYIDMFVKLSDSWESQKLDQSFQELFSFMDTTYSLLSQIVPLTPHTNTASSSTPQVIETNPGINYTEQQSLSQPQLSQSKSKKSPVASTSALNKNSGTKWTLRYQKLEPGIIELMPYSGVYVREIKLKQCLINCQNDAKKLARALLLEIFSNEALHKCSYTDSKLKVCKDKIIPSRPGLDLNARNTLINYVQNYSTEHGWQKDPTPLIITCLKNKLKVQRSKK